MSEQNSYKGQNRTLIIVRAELCYKSQNRAYKVGIDKSNKGQSRTLIRSEQNSLINVRAELSYKGQNRTLIKVRAVLPYKGQSRTLY